MDCKMEIKADVHAVHPSTSGTKDIQKTPLTKGSCGSWCTPEATPAHKELRKTASNIETTSQIQQDTKENEKNLLLQLQKVRLFSSCSPPQYSSANEITEADTELKDLKQQSANNSRKDDVQLEDKIEPIIEAPQSPVPISSERNKKCSGFVIISPVCDPFVPIDPQGRGYISWLLLVTFCYSYNAWCIALRATFPYQTPENTPIWMTADYLCDIVYLLDVALVKPKLMFLHEGFWVEDPKETRKHYRKKLQYVFDVVSLLPLDILYFYFGPQRVILRFPRLLKLQTFWEFHQAMDRVLSSPYVVRIGKTLFYIFYLIHLNACAYYAMSDYIGLGSNGWVYDNQGTAYIRCFYFATKTATSIGKNPKPEQTIEYLFMTAAWLMGVFVFALLIGQIRDIIATATRARTEYRKTVDGCTRYLRRLNMPSTLQRRVALWFNYTWSKQRCFGTYWIFVRKSFLVTFSWATEQHPRAGTRVFWGVHGPTDPRFNDMNFCILNTLPNESKILNSLPYNMKRDVALAVHMSTLSKVQLFRDCSASLLRDLVLQLRPVSFLPGDMVVRSGDVGHQMYIISSGECFVMNQDESEVLATLREGSVFGEISLLGIDGLRRRTATVRSRGYSSLFALSKNDLDAALKHHKEAAHILRIRADQIIRENAARSAKHRMRTESKRHSIQDDSGTVRRRPSTASSGSTTGEGRKLRSASALSKRRLSSVSEIDKPCRPSLASGCSGVRTPLPTIVLSSD